MYRGSSKFFTAIKIQRKISDGCACTGEGDTFMVVAKGYLNSPFKSNHANVKVVPSTQEGSPTLTIIITGSHDKVEMANISNEFKRAVVHLSNDYGRFDLMSRERDGIVSTYNDFLRQNGFPNESKATQHIQYSHRPNDNESY